MNPIRVAVSGGTGRVGREVVKYLTEQPDILVVAVVSRTYQGKTLQQVLPGFSQPIPIFSDLNFLLTTTSPQILVDFAPVSIAKQHFITCSNHGIHPVIGTTGFSGDEVKDMELIANERQLGAAIIPNFSLGALVTLQAAKLIAKVFDDVSLVEMYHHQKHDKPSGTSLYTYNELKAEQKLANKEIPIHCLRLSGVVAHQQIIFGGVGETVTLSHDVSDRKCFGPGVAQVIRNVGKFKHLVTNLADFLCLSS